MPNTAFVSTGSVLTATEFNYLPRGVINYQSLTTAYTTTGTHTTYQDDGLSVSVTYGANRLLRVTYQSHMFGSGGNNQPVVQLLQGATTLKEFFYTAVTVTSANGLDVNAVVLVATTTAGTATFKSQIRGLVNTAFQSFGAAGRPRQLIVEDIGSA